MRVELNISGDKFDLVGTSEARIFFSVPEQLPNIVVFDAWGVDLIYTFGKSRLDLITGINQHFEDIHIAGMATIKLTNVIGGELDMALLDNQTQDFFKDANGRLIRINKEWKVNRKFHGRSYTFGSVFNSPFGSGEISFITSGITTIEFETSDCISIDEYWSL